MTNDPDTNAAVHAIEEQARAFRQSDDADLSADTSYAEKRSPFYKGWTIYNNLSSGDDHKFGKEWNDAPIVSEIRKLLAALQTYFDENKSQFSLPERIFLSLKLSSLNREFHFRKVEEGSSIWHGNIRDIFMPVISILIILNNLFCCALPLFVSFTNNDADYWVLAIPNRLLMVVQMYIAIRYFRTRVLWDFFVVRLLAQPLFYTLLFCRWYTGFLDNELRTVEGSFAVGFVNLAVQMIVAYPVSLVAELLGLWSIYIAGHPSLEAQNDAKRIHGAITEISPRFNKFTERFKLSRRRQKEVAFIKFDLKILRKLLCSKLPERDRRQIRQSESLSWKEVAEIFNIFKRTVSPRVKEARTKFAAFQIPSTLVNAFATFSFSHSETTYIQSLFYTFFIFLVQLLDVFEFTVSIREMGTTFCLQGGGQLVMLFPSLPVLIAQKLGFRLLSHLWASIPFTVVGTVFIFTYADPFINWQMGWWYRRGVIPNEEGRYRKDVEADEHLHQERERGVE